MKIESTPKEPKSNYVVDALCFYPNRVVEVNENEKPSA
jgi:dTDP-glucose pyrophosphorylase